ncbi:MAG TPA: glycosyltransferase family 4 protein [Thermoplasmata archaeon]|nr:glycosyltransferase family 4 protein [Thermoplasmata archaeon]
MYVPNASLDQVAYRATWVMCPSAFRELGFESTLICGKFSGKKPPGIQVVETSLPVLNPRTGGRLRSLVEPFFAIREMYRRKPEIVLVGPFRSSLVTILPLVVLFRLTSKLLGRHSPAFMLKADWSLDASNLSLWATVFARALLSLSTFVLDIVSFETYCAIEKANQLPLIRTRKLVRVPVGSPEDPLLQSTYENQLRRPIILLVSRVARMKGLDVLLNAFSRLAGRYPDWSVRLVGPVDEPIFKKELLEIVTENSLEQRVVFIGALDGPELYREYSHASVFCLPSVRTESWGRVKCEATANGLPVVTTDVPCARDAIEAGWLVARAGDAEELAVRLEELMKDERERVRVSSVAQSRQRFFRELVEIYLFALKFQLAIRKGSIINAAGQTP